MIEVEIKLPVGDPEEIREKLIKNGFVRSAHLRERDTYFDDAAGGIRSGGQAFRIRETTDLETGAVRAQMNFKGKKLDTLTMTRQELESGVEQAEVCRQILESIGLHRTSPEVIKEREMLSRGDLTACVDMVHGLGSFLELEILVAEDRQKDAALGRIREVLFMLGYCQEDTVRTSYLTMLQKKAQAADAGQKCCKPE